MRAKRCEARNRANIGSKKRDRRRRRISIWCFAGQKQVESQQSEHREATVNKVSAVNKEDNEEELNVEEL